MFWAYVTKTKLDYCATLRAVARLRVEIHWKRGVFHTPLCGKVGNSLCDFAFSAFFGRLLCGKPQNGFVGRETRLRVGAPNEGWVHTLCMRPSERQVFEMKIVLLRSPGILAPILRRVFKIPKEKRHGRWQTSTPEPRRRCGAFWLSMGSSALCALEKNSCVTGKKTPFLWKKQFFCHNKFTNL